MNYIDRYNELAGHDRTVLIEERGDNPDYQTADPGTVNRFNYWLWYLTEGGAIRRQAVGMAVFDIRAEEERAEWYDSVPVILVAPTGPSGFYQQLAARAIQEQNADAAILSIHLNYIAEEHATRKFAHLTIWRLVAGNAVSSRLYVYLKNDGTLGVHGMEE